MKRVGGLWPQIVEYANLLSAYRKARRGKATRPAVARFVLDLETNLFNLQQALVEHRYRPGGYRLFKIYDRKPRQIAAAPFRDRVVHHALMNVVEPLLDRRFIHDCYACRKGKGVHAAVDRYQKWAQQYAFALKVDIQRYFPSIDHINLKNKLRRLIKDPDVLWLFDIIIDSAPKQNGCATLFPGDDLITLMQRRTGLPIGNLTSQFFGNLYLNDLDHYLKEHCGVKAYLRYVDDFVLLDNERACLWALKAEIDRYLEKERLRLHPNKAQVVRTCDGVNVLGFRVFPDHRRLRRDCGYRYLRRLKIYAKRYEAGLCELSDIRASVASWIGHACHADSWGLRRALLGSVYFQRGSSRCPDRARGSRRWLEQQTGERSFRQPQQERPR